jgi:hypothetical protein
MVGHVFSNKKDRQRRYCLDKILETEVSPLGVEGRHKYLYFPVPIDSAKLISVDAATHDWGWPGWQAGVWRIRRAACCELEPIAEKSHGSKSTTTGEARLKGLAVYEQKKRCGK